MSVRESFFCLLLVQVLPIRERSAMSVARQPKEPLDRLTSTSTNTATRSSLSATPASLSALVVMSRQKLERRAPGRKKLGTCVSSAENLKIWRIRKGVSTSILLSYSGREKGKYGVSFGRQPDISRSPASKTRFLTLAVMPFLRLLFCILTRVPPPKRRFARPRAFQPSRSLDSAAK